MLEEIIEYTNKLFDLDIKTDSRRREYVEARAFYCVVARKVTVKSLKQIGVPIKKDHATVLYALSNVIHFLDENQIEQAITYFKPFQKKKEVDSYIVERLKELQTELDKKNAVLSLMPKLESVYEKMNSTDYFIAETTKRKGEYYLSIAGDYISELNKKINELCQQQQ